MRESEGVVFVFVVCIVIVFIRLSFVWLVFISFESGGVGNFFNNGLLIVLLIR